jgi:hypothetical protein
VATADTAAALTSAAGSAGAPVAGGPVISAAATIPLHGDRGGVAPGGAGSSSSPGTPGSGVGCSRAAAAGASGVAGTGTGWGSSGAGTGSTEDAKPEVAVSCYAIPLTIKSANSKPTSPAGWRKWGPNVEAMAATAVSIAPQQAGQGVAPHNPNYMQVDMVTAYCFQS